MNQLLCMISSKCTIVSHFAMKIQRSHRIDHAQGAEEGLCKVLIKIAMLDQLG